MPTSGTASFNPDVATLIEEAYERAGVEGRSGYELRSAIRSLNLLAAEWANKGLNLWTIEQGTMPLLAGVASYALPADTIDFIDVYVRTGGNDYRLERIGVGTYAAISNKTMAGQPSQYFIERKATPILNVWPVPSTATTLVSWRLRRIQDAGAVDNDMDVPFRFLPALAAGLAVKLAMKRQDFRPDRLQALQADYMELLNEAIDEDRGRESFWIKGRRR